jgi:hypothetical protein
MGINTANPMKYENDTPKKYRAFLPRLTARFALRDGCSVVLLAWFPAIFVSFKICRNGLPAKADN